MSNPLLPFLPIYRITVFRNVHKIYSSFLIKSEKLLYITLTGNVASFPLRSSPKYRRAVPSSPSSRRRYRILALLFTHIFRVIVSGGGVRNCCLISLYTGKLPRSTCVRTYVTSLPPPPIYCHIVRRRAREGQKCVCSRTPGRRSRGSVKNPHATVTANTG